ncbi:hypothetical protein TALC_01000 [Thermoplasmatales archaeon BRNA1]|nr:hypothetical protein TALC_01000 [Thermoplasmatales archaeon BRNA1]
MDGRGVIGFPVRIGVAFLLVALCVPAISYAVDAFQESSELQRVDGEVDSIIEASGRIYFGGAGCSCTIDVHVEPGYEIWIGGEGPEAYSVSVVKGSSVRERTYAENPSVRFLGERMVLTGDSELLLECARIDGVYGIRVTER